MKNIKIITVIVLIIFTLGACSSSVTPEKPEEISNTPTPVTNTEPTAAPTVSPTLTPSLEPTALPTAVPTAEPTTEPIADPTVEPTAVPDVSSGTDYAELSEDDRIFIAYLDFLRDFAANSDDTESIRVQMGYLDEDDICELLIFDGDEPDDTVTVVKYHDGKAVNVGEFGEGGTFSYLTGQNKLFTRIYGHGYTYIEVSHIENGVGLCDCTLTEMYDDGSYIVNGDDVSADVYNYFLEKYYTSAFGNTSKEIKAEFEYASPAADILKTEDVLLYFASMKNMAFMQEKGVGMFADPEVFEQLDGTWNLTKLEFQRDGETYLYKQYDYEQSTCMAYSELTIENGHAGLWFQLSDPEIWDSEPMISTELNSLEMTFTSDMPQAFTSYEWVILLSDPDDYDTETFIAMPDYNHISLIQYNMVEGQDAPEVITASYIRNYYDANKYKTVAASMKYNAEDDTDDCYAFNITEQIFIEEGKSSLLAEYGYPDGLDGWDFVIEEKHGVEPYTIYLPKDGSNMYITVLNGMMFDSEISIDELASRLADYDRIMYLYYNSDDMIGENPDKTFIVPAAILEPYLG